MKNTFARLTILFSMTCSAAWSTSALAAELFKPLSSEEKLEDVLPLSKLPPKFPFEPSPVIFNKEVIQEMVTKSVETLTKSLGITQPPKVSLHGTNDWANYVNYHHFVPLTAEGVPTGHGLNFTYNDGRPQGLPIGELIETGEMILWWESCNYYESTKSECARSIHRLVAHELRHFMQWKKLFESSAQKKWFDVAHYQCREVEVYVAQAANQERDKRDLYGPSVLQYVKACQDSQWKDEFKDSFELLKRLTTR